MAPSHLQGLAEVSGVVIPSKLPARHQPLRPPDTTKLDSVRKKTCPICGHAARDSYNIRLHFVACVKRNGNPTGARWDENLSFNHFQRRKQANTHASAKSDTSTTSNKPPSNQSTAKQRSERSNRYHARLAAVNGVVIPSKLAPGETPVRRNINTSEGYKHPCPICGRLHKSRNHVQSHFAACVETNGNPTGARWDDACKETRSRAGRVSTEASRTPLASQTQQHQLPGYPITDPGFDVALIDPLLLNGYQNSDLHPLPSPSDGFEPSGADLEYLDPELVASSPSYARSYTTFPTIRGLFDTAKALYFRTSE